MDMIRRVWLATDAGMRPDQQFVATLGAQPRVEPMCPTCGWALQETTTEILGGAVVVRMCVWDHVYDKRGWYEPVHVPCMSPMAVSTIPGWFVLECWSCREGARVAMP